jgi:hypothetical protein
MLISFFAFRLTTCVQKEWADGNWSLGPQPPAGQLNPLSDNVYEVSQITKHINCAACS